MSSSAMSGKKKNFQKWRSKNSSDSEKPQESKVKVIEPFVLTFKQRAKYSQWKSAFTDQAKYEFGLLGQMCELEEYPEPPPVEMSDFDLSSGNAEVTRLNRGLLLSAAQTRAKSMHLMELEKPKLYSLIKRYLSTESLGLVMQCEDFDVEKDINDPLKLWMAVKTTHRPGSDAVDKSHCRVETWINLTNCKQLAEEPIYQFYDRWKYSYDTFVDAGNTKLDDRDQANLFLASVSNAIFGQVKAEVFNDTLKGEDTPSSVALMYHYICRYVTVKKDVKSNYGAAFATLGEEYQSRKPNNSALPGKGRNGGKQNKGAKAGGVNKSGGDKKG